MRQSRIYFIENSTFTIPPTRNLSKFTGSTKFLNFLDMDVFWGKEAFMMTCGKILSAWFIIFKQLFKIHMTSQKKTYFDDAKWVGALLQLINSVPLNNVAATLLFEGRISLIPSATNVSLVTSMSGPLIICGIHSVE